MTQIPGSIPYLEDLASYDPLSGKVELLFCVIYIARCIDSGRSFIPPHMLLLCWRCCCCAFTAAAAVAAACGAMF